MNIPDKSIFTEDELVATGGVPAAVVNILSIHPTPAGCVTLVTYPHGQYKVLRFRDGVAYSFSAPLLSRSVAVDVYAAECVQESGNMGREGRATR